MKTEVTYYSSTATLNAERSQPRFLAPLPTLQYPTVFCFCFCLHTVTMGDEHGIRPSPIGGLPVELVRMILSAMTDVVSLRAAVLSCPQFYRSFLHSEKSIARLVLLRQIDACVLPEAMAAVLTAASRLSESQPPFANFVNQDLYQRPVPPKALSMRMAFLLGRFHVCVDGMAKKFAMAALAERPLNQTTSTVTCQERCRIERALYRFEIYCNLFRNSSKMQSLSYDMKRKYFFARFAPWENEQLGCIYDFLARAVSPGQLPRIVDCCDMLNLRENNSL